jgi:hypothetical protein
MKRPTWTLVIGIFAVLFGIANGLIASIDLSQVKGWKSLNAMFAPAQNIIASQGVEGGGFILGMIAPPAWFVQVVVQMSWATIGLGVIFVISGIGLMLYRRFGMLLLALALVLNIAVQVFYSTEAVRSMSVQSVLIPSRAFWIAALNLLLLLVIGIGSLRWFRFNRPAAVQI